MHHFYPDRALPRGPSATRSQGASSSQAPASASRGAAPPADIDGLVDGLRGGCNRLRDSVTDVDVEWGDLANAERDFQEAAERALAALTATQTEISALRRMADNFVAQRAQTQRAVGRWEDRRVREVDELEDLVRRLPAVVAAASDEVPAAGAPATGPAFGAPARVLAAGAQGFLVEVHGKRLRKARDISQAEDGTLCALIHAILAHGRAPAMVNKELLELGLPGRSLDLRPHVRWARGWCEASLLASGLRLEADCLFMLMRRDNTRTHRWGYSADGEWVYSDAAGTTVLQNIREDLAESRDKYAEHERELIAAGVQNFRPGPAGAAWLTSSGEDFGREAALYWGLPVLP